ncbi:hypothetical protein [Arthrobacter sp. 7Tela_A1]|uniref:DUF4190 domain-containing protein n=1 Tax=Arthrobacter sp. 7Tela_A1 TaxID=3093745 RepID=UPI003BB691B3
MSENRNNAGADQPEAQPAKPEEGTQQVPDSGAPTQPLYGQYSPQSGQSGQSGQSAPGGQPFASPGNLPYGQQQEAPAASYGQQTPYSEPNSYGQQTSYAEPNSYGQQQGYSGTQQGYPGYGQQPSPYGYPNYQAPATKPGKTMGIVGLVLSCLFFIPFASVVGLILSIVGFVQSRKAKLSNGPALAGIIVGAVVFALTLLMTIAVFVFAADAAMTIVEACEANGPGEVYIDGEYIECEADFEQSL